MCDSWQRFEDRLEHLENAMDSRKTSGQELARVVRELLDLKQTFCTKLESRPTVKEGIAKYQMLLQLADEKDGVSNWTTAPRKEILINELPQLRNIFSVVESFHQLQVFLDTPLPFDVLPLIQKLRETNANLRYLLGRVNHAEGVHERFVETQDDVVTLTEEKLMEMDSKLNRV